jgi:hypothetical protein
LSLNQSTGLPASAALVILGAALALALATPALIQFGAAQSAYVRADNQSTDYTVGLLCAALIAISIGSWPIRRSMKVPMLWAWLFRTAVAMFLSLFYFHAYPSLDLYSYFATRTAVPGWSQLGFGAGTLNIAALVWAIHKVIPDSFYAMNLIFTLLSLIGVYCFWVASEAFLGYASRRFFYLLMLEPSLTFWTASMGKDSVVTFGVGLYTNGVVRWWRTRRGVHLLQAAAGVAVAGLIRPWMAAILIGPLMVLVYSLERGIVSRAITTTVLAFAVNAAMPFILQSLYLQTAQDLTEQVSGIQGRFNAGESAGVAYALNDPNDLMKYAPLGMFSALFRPLPGDVQNGFGVLASLEDVIMLGLFARALLGWRWRSLRDPLVCWALGVVIFWGLIYAFVSSQNYGTAVRYRTQIFPILLGLMLYLGRASRHTDARADSLQTLPGEREGTIRYGEI